MKINLTEQAVIWFKQELDFEDHQALKFYVRYGGEVQLKQGFSPAFTVDKVDHEGYIETMNGLTYFVDEKDLWYFEGHTLNVSIENDEVHYEIVQ